MNIFLHVLLHQLSVRVDDADDVIQMLFEFKPDREAQSHNLPISTVFSLPIRQGGQRWRVCDQVLLTFVDGACSCAYRPWPGLPLGVFRIHSVDLPSVPVDGQRCDVRLAKPVAFTVARALAAF